MRLTQLKAKMLYWRHKRVLLKSLRRRVSRWFSYFRLRAFCEYLIKIHFGGFYERPVHGFSYTGSYAPNYISGRERTESWARESRAITSLLNELPKGISVLDVPFGTGRFVEQYVSRNMTVFGLDKSPEMIDVARRELESRFNTISIALGDATTMPFSDQSLDLIVCMRFLPHLISYGDVKRVMAKFQRVARRYLIVELGERSPSQYRRRMPTNRELIGTWFYPAENTRLLERYGFRLVRKTEALHPGVTHSTQYCHSYGAWHAFMAERSQTAQLQSLRSEGSTLTREV